MTATPLASIAGLWLLMWPDLTGTPVVTFPLPERADVRSEDIVPSPEALLEAGDDELLARILSDPGSLGPLSIGDAGSGRLFNPVAVPDDPRWVIGNGAQTWTTTETITSLETGIATVNELFPDTHPVRIGDVSDADGGRLKRHLSHQSGRDVDVCFYFKGGEPGHFVVGTDKNLDLPRNWALVRAWVTRTDVDVILLDTRIQRLLYRYALSIGEDKDWLDHVFQFSRGYREAIVQHVRGHRNHYHVRFFNTVAQELGRRAYPLLVKAELMPPPIHTVRHVVRTGQTIGHLASRYGTSVKAIQNANGLRSTLLRAGRAYRIPVKAAVAQPAPIKIPQRLLPPSTPPAFDAVTWPTASLAGSFGGERH